MKDFLKITLGAFVGCMVAICLKKKFCCNTEIPHLQMKGYEEVVVHTSNIDSTDKNANEENEQTPSFVEVEKEETETKQAVKRTKTDTAESELY